jgi:membrane-associated phospholipid phosphatase
MIETSDNGVTTRQARRGLPGGRWWIAPTALVVVFGLLLWQVASHGPVTRLDLHLRNAIQSAAAEPDLSWLRPIGRGLADLGDQPVALPVLLAATLLALWSARRRALPPLAVAATAALILAAVVPLKIWVARPGPGEVTLGNAVLGFFPSGHTADAMLCYGAAAVLLCGWVLVATWARRVIWGVFWCLLAGTIFGLLWSNYHWASDIAGSLCWCGAGLLVMRREAGGRAGRG